MSNLDFSSYRQNFLYPHSPLNRWHKFAEEVIPLWVADMDDAADPELIRIIQNRCARGHFGYVAPPATLYQALIDYCARHYHWTIEREWIVFIPGVVMGLAGAVQSQTREQQSVIVPQPVYAPFYEVVEGANRHILPYAFSIQENRLMPDNPTFTNESLKNAPLLMWCSPHNPGGTVFSREELMRIGQWAIDHDKTIVCDEIHADMGLIDNDRHIPLASLSGEIAERTLTLMSPNKAFNIPSIGLAYAIIPNRQKRAQFCATMAPWKFFSPLALESAYYCLTEGEAWLAQVLRRFRAHVERVCAWGQTHQNQVRVIRPQASYLIWIQLIGDALPADPVAHFARHGVGINSGTLYRASNDWIRLNIATTTEVLEEALKRMRRALADF